MAADFFESDRVSIKTDSKKALAKFLDTSCMLLLVQSDEHQSFTMTNKVIPAVSFANQANQWAPIRTRVAVRGPTQTNLFYCVQNQSHHQIQVEDLTTGRTLIFTKKKTRPVRWPDDQSDLLLFPISEHRGDSLDQLFSKIHDPIIQHV